MGVSLSEAEIRHNIDIIYKLLNQSKTGMSLSKVSNYLKVHPLTTRPYLWLMWGIGMVKREIKRTKYNKPIPRDFWIINPDFNEERCMKNLRIAGLLGEKE